MYIVRVNVKSFFSKYRSKSYLQDYFGQGLSICITIIILIMQEKF